MTCTVSMLSQVGGVCWTLGLGLSAFRSSGVSFAARWCGLLHAMWLWAFLMTRFVVLAVLREVGVDGVSEQCMEQFLYYLVKWVQEQIAVVDSVLQGRVLQWAVQRLVNVLILEGSRRSHSYAGCWRVNNSVNHVETAFGMKEKDGDHDLFVVRRERLLERVLHVEEGGLWQIEGPCERIVSRGSELCPGHCGL